MNRLSCKLLIVYIASLFFFLSEAGFAAPVGNIGDPMLWNPGPFRQKGGLSLIVSTIFEKQTNNLPDQITRFVWTNPDITPLEERHYKQLRSSKNKLKTMGAKIGVPYKDSAVFYTSIGSADATVDFHYEDWTISRVFAQDKSFSDTNVYFGFGTSFILHKADYKLAPVTLGMDISYRHFSIEEDRLSADGIYYSSDLDELQLALCLSTKIKQLIPYAGFKAASITGKEEYTNRNNRTSYFSKGYIDYKEDITWSKNIGYFIGVTTSVKGIVSVGIEFREGDERALGLTATTRF